VWGYTCPSGGTLSGSTCLKTTTYGATLVYSCNPGATLSGTTCLVPETYSCPPGCSETKASSYAASCPAGYTQSGSQCVASYAASAKTAESSYAATYSGDSSYPAELTGAYNMDTPFVLNVVCQLGVNYCDSTYADAPVTAYASSAPFPGSTAVALCVSWGPEAIVLGMGIFISPKHLLLGVFRCGGAYQLVPMGIAT